MGGIENGGPGDGNSKSRRTSQRFSTRRQLSEYVGFQGGGAHEGRKVRRKNGGIGWTNFFKDLMVAMGSVDKELEATVKTVTDMKKKGAGHARWN